MYDRMASYYKWNDARNRRMVLPRPRDLFFWVSKWQCQGRSYITKVYKAKGIIYLCSTIFKKCVPFGSPFLVMENLCVSHSCTESCCQVGQQDITKSKWSDWVKLTYSVTNECGIDPLENTSRIRIGIIYMMKESWAHGSGLEVAPWPSESAVGT
jgi:hypothetical protein